MPKRLITGFFVFLFVFFFFFPFLASADGKIDITAGVIADSGQKSLTGSYVYFDPGWDGAECYEAGVAADFAFYAESNSPDWEYCYYLWLSFPEGWVVNSVTSAGEGCDNGTWGTLSYTVQDPANAVQIYHTRYHGSGGATCYCWYMVNATPGPAAGDADVSWYWDGDGYGGAPHHPCSSDGYTPAGQDACDEMVAPPALIPACSVEQGIYLVPEEQTIVECAGIPVDFTLNLANMSGSSGDIALSYSVMTGNGSVSGPGSINLADGDNIDFTVTLTSDTGLSDETIVSATIEAVFNAFSDTAAVNQEIFTQGWVDIASTTILQDNVVVAYNGYIWDIMGYGSGNQLVRYYDPGSDSWTEVADSEFGNCYTRSGAVYGNKVYVYGDTVTAGFTGLWSYNMDTNAWTNESPSGTAPAHTGIWAPAWVADPNTGYLYITGGATVAGGGDLTTVYVYDPAGNAWLAPLPNFSTPRDFHAAFIYEDPSTLHKMLAVVGGLYGSTELASTQCYDFETGVWNAENADIAVLPISYWGFGYTHNIHQDEHQLWLVGGASNWMIWNGSLYYDIAAGAWTGAGPPHETESYRLGAASLNGEVYKVTGNNSLGACSKYYYCETSAAGDTCDNPIVVSIPAGLDFEDPGQTTCGRGDSYTDDFTYYNNGEDIFYRLDITEDASVTIEMVPYATWTGLFLYSDCPADLDPGDWIAAVYNSTTDPRIIEIDLLASQSPYYIMCDSWPSPECFEFDLYIYGPSAEGPDFSIIPSDIWFEPSSPMPGDAVTIYGRAYNIGDQNVDSWHVSCYYSLEPGVDLQLIDEADVAVVVEPGNYFEGSFVWNTDPAMDPRMYIITLELTDILPEDTNPDNNTAFIEIPLPVDLSFFTAQGMGNTVSVQWMTVSETDNLGFNLYRLRGDKVSPFISFMPVKLNDSIIEGQGTSSEPRTYSFTDRVKNQGNYIYILECISTEGIATDEYRTRVQWLF